MKQSPEVMEAVRIALSMPAVRTFSRSTVYLLMRHIEALEQEVEQHKADEQLAVKKADRMKDNVVQLQRELWEKQKDGKVALPKEVAQAIDSLRNDSWDNITILRNAVSPLDMTTARSQAIRDFARMYIFDLTRALEFGYTVEKTREELLNDGIKRLVAQWERETGNGMYEVLPHLHDRVSTFVQRFYAQSTAANG